MTKTIHGHALVTSALGTDELLIWDVTNSIQRRITKANLIGATITGDGTLATGGFTLTIGANSTINGTLSGGGTVATGGFTLTVPATGTAMLLATTQTITGNKTFSGTLTVSGAATFSSTFETSGAVGLNNTPNTSTAQVILTSGDAARRAMRVNMPSSPTTEAMDWTVNGTQRAVLNLTDTVTNMWLVGADFGTGRGPTLSIDRNTNGSTPAAGNLFIEARTGTNYFIWPDASGNLRIGTTAPTNANDGSGTVVGTQTSHAASKLIDDQLPDYRQSLTHIRDVVKAGALRGWRYRSEAYNNEHFPIGLVVDYAPRYGMDRGNDAPHGRSLNVPVAIGDLFAAVAELAERIEAL